MSEARMKLRARITGDDVEETYEVEIPAGLPNNLCYLIAFGLFFQHDWTMDDTSSEWEIIE